MLATASRSRRGFSLVEAVVVLGLLGLLALAVLPRLDLQRGLGDDGTAQVSIETVLDAQVALKRSAGRFFAADPSDVDGLSRLSAAAPELTFVDGTTVSDSPKRVSIAVSTDGNTVAVAALGGNSTCWMVRRDFAAPLGSPSVVHAYQPSTAALPVPCTGASALSSLAGKEGPSWGEPLELG